MPKQSIPISLVILLAMITGLDALAIDLHLPAFGAMALSLGASERHVALTLTAFLIGMGLGQAIWSALLDRMGRRNPTLLGLGLFVATSLLCALAPTLETLVAARAAQGFAAAVVVTVPRVIVADLCDEREQAQVFSTLMQVFLIVPVVAPLLGGLLLDPLGWRGLHGLLAVAGLAAGAWAMGRLPETQPIAQRQPLAPKRLWQSYRLLLGDGRMLVLLALNMLVSGVLFAYLGHLPGALLHDLGFAPLQISGLFAANGLGLILAGTLNKWLLRKMTPAAILARAIGIIVLAGLGMALLSGLGIRALLWPALLLLFIAIGTLSLAFPNLTAMTMAAADAERGTGSALLGLAQSLGGAVVGALAGLWGPGMMGLGLGLATPAALSGLLLLSPVLRRRGAHLTGV